MNLAAVLGIPGLLEQPRKSKMRKLLEWLYLVINGLASETWTASCGYGSPLSKSSSFYTLLRKYTEDSSTHPIEGKLMGKAIGSLH